MNILKKTNKMKNYRLTVHLEGQPHVQKETSKWIYQYKGTIYKTKEEAPKESKRLKEKKTICHNTLSFYFKTKEECIQKLSEIRSKYTIALGKNNQKMHKYGQELFNISWVN
mgnify:CR=1 FL=1|tara:strand:+ start:373 stop:708 length:336 start_codon:yes stop_codon:yes gene_type:complete